MEQTFDEDKLTFANGGNDISESVITKMTGDYSAASKTMSLKGTSDTKVEKDESVISLYYNLKNEFVQEYDYTFTYNFTEISLLDDRSLDAEDSTVTVTFREDFDYVVTFNPNNGSPNTVQVVANKEKATAIADPVKLGYTFDYWYSTNEDTAFNFDTAITDDVTLTAKYKKQSTLKSN